METFELKEEIKKIVVEEFSKLVNNIEGDFKKNYIKKRYNFLLNQLDETIIANMVFVSSFESKCGFAIETCAKKIARLKFGNENAFVSPNLVNSTNVSNRELVKALIVYGYDSNKDRWNWICLRINKL